MFHEQFFQCIVSTDNNHSLGAQYEAEHVTVSLSEPPKLPHHVSRVHVQVPQEG